MKTASFSDLLRPIFRVLAKATALLGLLTLMSLSGLALAQEDTTPPVLLDFTISPTVFDTSLGDVRINFCVTSADDFSGVSSVGVRADDIQSRPLTGFFGLVLTFQGTTSPTEVCAFAIVPIGSLQKENLIEISLVDRVENRRVIKHPLHPCTGLSGCESATDLCAAGFPCSIENRSFSSLPDPDGDGVPDIADNCPNDSNPNQEDRDLDLIGDACDPFPDDRDNEQAQCEEDLTLCEDDLTQCLANDAGDQDGDDEADITDACPNTPASTEVDDAGCSLKQFCTAINATTSLGVAICKHSDWKNNEPLMKAREKDCMVVGTRANRQCVPSM